MFTFIDDDLPLRFLIVSPLSISNTSEKMFKFPLHNCIWYFSIRKVISSDENLQKYFEGVKFFLSVLKNLRVPNI